MVGATTSAGRRRLLRPWRGEGEREKQGGMRCRGGRAGDVGVVQILQRRGRQAGDAVARAAASRCPSSAYWQRWGMTGTAGWAGPLLGRGWALGKWPLAFLSLFLFVSVF